jgi:hypothetical protein
VAALYIGGYQEDAEEDTKEGGAELAVPRQGDGVRLPLTLTSYPILYRVPIPYASIPRTLYYIETLDTHPVLGHLCIAVAKLVP